MTGQINTSHVEPRDPSDAVDDSADVSAENGLLDAEVTERLAKLVAAAARVPTRPEDVTAETSLLDDLDIDSILLVELIVNIELEFGIELEDEDTEISRMIRFGALARTVAHRAAAE